MSPLPELAAVDWEQLAREATETMVDDLGTFRTRRRKHPLVPYESLEASPRYLATGFRGLLEQRMVSGYHREGFAIPSIVGPIDWNAHNRSFSYHLHAWEPITELLMGHSRFGDRRYFEAARGFAFSWLESHQFPSFAIGPDPAKLAMGLGAMPWYDMAVAQRVYRLSYIVDVMCRDACYDEQDIYLANRSLIFHLRLLSREEFFSGHSNHGFYQALGELAATRRFREVPFFGERFRVAQERARAAIDQQFHPGGIHKEHSPGYHYMVMGTLIEARASGLVDFADLSERVAACEEAFTWLMQPDGSLLTFGDTDPRVMRFSSDRFRNEHLRYQVSGGSIGERPPEALLAMKDEGYVFARSEYPDDSADTWWYLAQIASFHSRVHKHADDLSFVWSDGGCQILVDPGRFAFAGKTKPGTDLAKQGFWYGDPRRVYVESTRAHNTVEIDGRSYDRRRMPYGSALKYAGRQEGLIVTECELAHQTVLHWRVLVMAPGSFLFVFDRLVDETGLEHDYRQHFHFHPDWTVSRDWSGDNPARLVAVHQDNGRRLTVVPLLQEPLRASVARGQEEPELLGWFSDRAYSLIPSATIALHRPTTDVATFATLFSLTGDSTPLPPMTGQQSLDSYVFAWRNSGELLRLELRRGHGDDPVSVTIEREVDSTGDRPAT